MNEYLLAFLTVNNWATNFYQQLLGSADSSIGSTVNQFLSLEPNISSAIQWNRSSRDLLASVGGIYEDYNLVYRTLYGMDSRFKAEISRIEGAISTYQSMSDRLKISAPFAYSPSARFDLDLSQKNWVDYSPDYYNKAPLLDVETNERSLILGNAGTFSCIRSQGGFVGTVVIENILGQVVNESSPELAFDGVDTTQWMASSKLSSPIKIDPSIVGWLSSRYQQGAAVRMRVELERPVLISELFIDPLSSDPMSLDSIAWRPLDAENLLGNSNFNSLNEDGTVASWTCSSSSAIIVAGAGLDRSSALKLTNSATIQQRLDIGTEGMLDFHWIQKGTYGAKAGFTTTWILSDGSILTTTQKTFELSRTWSNCAFSIHIPTGVSSAIVQFGLIQPNDNVTVWIDNAFVGVNKTESQFFFTEEEARLDRPKTLMFPRAIFSDTFWLVFVQSHSRQGVWPVIENQVDAPANLSPELNLAWQLAALKKSKVHSSNSQMFEYEFGAKEIDFRYNEFISTGRAVTVPFLTANEIREIWVESIEGVDAGISYSISVTPQVPQETPTRQEVIPANSLISSTLPRKIKVYTSEEVEAGWSTFSSDTEEKIAINIIDPLKKTYISAAGTDRFGKLLLPFTCHTRMPQVISIQTFLASSYPKPIDFDPNSTQVQGMSLPGTGSTLTLAGYYNSINSIMANRSDIELSSVSQLGFTPTINIIPGYVPIKVTVETDSWKASPDTFGKPEKGRVRFVRFENMEANTLTTSRKVAASDPYPFGTSTVFNNGVPAGTDFSQKVQRLSGGDVRFKLSDGTYSIVSSSIWEDYLRKAARALSSPAGTSSVMYAFRRNSTEKVAQRSINTYQTQYYPLVWGSKNLTNTTSVGNALIRLWWYKALPTPVVFPIGVDGYRITDPSLGLVEVLMAPPSSGCTLVADYWHASEKEAQEPYSWSLALTLPVSGYSLDDGYKVVLTSRSYPVTRNMTDYIYGKIPSLRTPQFDAMQDDYYPVIEYYLNGNNELVFSTEFFEYGDNPARITVDYETLQVVPRLFIDMTRAYCISTRTPKISSVSLCARERQQLLRQSGGS